ncbi:MAG TPA: HlyD family secretion protein [Geminicoccaceae bacterium]|nr:HlyD family secretion protein [Geminicoccaceae bacterium]
MSAVTIDDEMKKASFEGEVGTAPPRSTAAWRPRGRLLLRFGAIGLLFVIAALVLGHWLMDRWTHVYVNDSRIAADIVTLSSEVEGRITAIAVVAGDRVAQGDLLVAIDRRQAELELHRIDADIARIEATQSELRAQQDMIRKEVSSKLAADKAAVAAGEADHRAAEAELERARSEYERVQSLFERKVVASQRLEEAQARFTSAQQQELHTAAEIDRARANLAMTEAGQAQVTVLERQIASLDAEKAAQLAQRGQQLIDLEHREMRAPFDGVIDETFVDVGEYVAPGTRLLMYHDPTKVWVDANVKETEFGRVRDGAPATITVDAYPDREFHGTVARLGHAATSEFALLPTPNPSGNFTKVTQRLPVRITLEQKEQLLRPGMMVEVAIDVVD